jgi:hypothetical protein
MKKNLLFILFVSTIQFISCESKQNEVSPIIENGDSLNNTGKVNNLKSDYLFTNLDDNHVDKYSGPFSFSICFRKDSLVIMTYKSRNYNYLQIESFTYLKTNDTINFILNPALLSLWSQNFINSHQIPKQLVIQTDGSLIVTEVNKLNNEVGEESVVSEVDTINSNLTSHTLGKQRGLEIILFKVSDIIKPSTMENIVYYEKSYPFRTDDLKPSNKPAESKCADMISWSYGYSLAADQLGGGLIADCDYLFTIAQTQRDNINHYCFCKGVNDWISEHR